MGKTFKHLDYKQRLKIKEYLDMDISKTDIAHFLGIHTSTVYREIERGTIDGSYDPDYADDMYNSKLSEKGFQCLCNVSPELAQYIAELILNERLSPAKIIDKLHETAQWTVVPKSKNTIYKAIDNGLIPGVTRKSLNSNVTVVFNDGQIHIAKWVRSALNIEDGDELSFEVKDNKLIFSKANKKEEA